MVTTEVAVVGGAVDSGAGSAAVSETDPAGKGRGRIAGDEDVMAGVSSAMETKTSAMMLVAVSTTDVAATEDGGAHRAGEPFECRRGLPDGQAPGTADLRHLFHARSTSDGLARRPLHHRSWRRR